MAQLTKGILFQWGAPGDSDAAPESWKTIPDVRSIPTLIGAPTNHDVTILTSEQKVYLEGLPDNGGQLAFGVVFTPELFTAVDAIRTAQETSNPYFRVALPAPLSKAYVFRGTMAIPANEQWEPDNPMFGNLNVTPSTSIELKDYSPGS